MTHYIDSDPANHGRPSQWISDPLPGGWVCAVPDDASGICGTPIESEPCADHKGPCKMGGPYTVETAADGWPELLHECGCHEGYTTWWPVGDAMEATYSLA